MSITKTQGPIADRVVRHRGIDRIYHWSMAAALLVCLFTAFLPIMGWKFEWVTPHWISGVVLTAVVLFHIVRATVFQDFWSIVVGPRDFVSAWRMVRRCLGQDAPPPLRNAKYTLAQKLFHKLAATIVLGMIITGLLMLSKIDTWFWRRNPYWLADDQWGVVYAVHDVAAMALITLTMVHIYFALRPDEWWMTRSMWTGWIRRADYEAHHDPERWDVTQQ
jgi:cytochrome b subunit of formate dehydrogenase